MNKNALNNKYNFIFIFEEQTFSQFSWGPTIIY